MKSIKFIVGALVVSFALNMSGALAWISGVESFAGFKIPNFKNATSVGWAQKNDYSSEAINILSTSSDRDIQFRVEDKELGFTADYQTLKVGSSKVAYAIGREGIATSALSVSVLMEGQKKLYLRTANSWLSSTDFNGTWWLSLSDYEKMYGPITVNGSGFIWEI